MLKNVRSSSNPVAPSSKQLLAIPVLALAMVAAIRGYKTACFIMPDKISEEKRAILRAYGAQVVITVSGVEPDDPQAVI
jgi:hypothetical protein